MDAEVKMEPGKNGSKQETNPKTNFHLHDRTIPILSSSSNPPKGRADPLSSRCVLHSSTCSATTPFVPDGSASSDSGNEAELVKFLQQTRISDVDAWLDTVFEDRPNSNVSTLETPTIEANNPTSGLDIKHGKGFNRKYLETDSNKENISPSGTSSETTSSEYDQDATRALYKPQGHRRSFSEHSSLQSYYSGGDKEVPVPMTATPVLLRKTQPSQTPQASEVNRGYHLGPDKPSNSFSLPPRRKKMRSAANPMPARTDLAYDKSQQFEIAEDEEAEQDILGLSPHVTQHRKGKGPKRVRCASYFDRDLFEKSKAEGTKSVGNGNKSKGVVDGERMVLGELKQDSSGDSGDGDASGEGDMEAEDGFGES